MARKNGKKKTLRDKRIETFVDTFGMSPKEFLDGFNKLPNRLRTRQNYKEARAIE